MEATNEHDPTRPFKVTPFERRPEGKPSVIVRGPVPTWGKVMMVVDEGSGGLAEAAEIARLTCAYLNGDVPEPPVGGGTGPNAVGGLSFRDGVEYATVVDGNGETIIWITVNDHEPEYPLGAAHLACTWLNHIRNP